MVSDLTAQQGVNGYGSMGLILESGEQRRHCTSAFSLLRDLSTRVGAKICSPPWPEALSSHRLSQHRDAAFRVLVTSTMYLLC